MSHDNLRLLLSDWNVRNGTPAGSLFEPLTRALASIRTRLQGSDGQGGDRFSVGTMSTRWLEQLEHDISKHPDRG